MDKLSKYDKENIIIRYIFENKQLVVKEWLNEDLIPKNSINYLIKSLESNGFIKSKSRKPKIVDFTHKISQILFLIGRGNNISKNELANNFNDNGIDDILDRLIDIKIIKMDIENNTICYRMDSEHNSHSLSVK